MTNNNLMHNDKSMSHHPNKTSVSVSSPPSDDDGAPPLIYDWSQSSQDEAPVGLENAGNWCYLNCTFQALCNVPAIHHYLERFPLDRIASQDISADASLGYCFINDFQRVVSESKGKDQLQSRLSDTIANISNKSAEHNISGHGQQDVLEFLGVLIESIDVLAHQNQRFLADVRSESCVTALRDLIRVSTKECLRCQECNEQRQKYETSMFCKLPLERRKTVRTMFKEFFSKGEVLSGSNAVLCQSCNRKTTTALSSDLHKAPPVLVIQLPCFQLVASELRKKRHALKVPEFLSSQDNPSYVLIYELSSMVAHIGNSMHSGHYVSYCFESSDMCIRYSDQSMQVVGLGPCKDDLQVHKKSETPYVLFYTLKARERVS